MTKAGWFSKTLMNSIKEEIKVVFIFWKKNHIVAKIMMNFRDVLFESTSLRVLYCFNQNDIFFPVLISFFFF